MFYSKIKYLFDTFLNNTNINIILQYKNNKSTKFININKLNRSLQYTSKKMHTMQSY